MGKKSRWGSGLALAVLLAAAPTGSLRADEVAAPRPGLMWNRTGLPAVFPLQIKTPPGRDYHVLLSHAEGGTEAVAAYFHGGAFFRLLVPPGTFRVRISHGLEWQGEALLFGAGDRTQAIVLGPLDFRIGGVGRKEGYLIDLSGTSRGGAAMVTRLAFCQMPDEVSDAGEASALIELPPLPPGLRDPDPPLPPVGPMPQPDWVAVPQAPDSYRWTGRVTRTRLWSRLCD